MTSVQEKHHQAMALTDEAFLARRQGNIEGASQFFQQAFQQEREAAEQADREGLPEPTRSVLYRSAATLALDCHLFRDAERLAARGLSGDPPEDVADELRAVLANVYRFWPKPSDKITL